MRPVGKFIVQQMAAVAELERGLISQRTKAALAMSKKKLGGYRGGNKPDAALATIARQKAADGFASAVAPMLREMQATGASLRKIAAEMAVKGIRTAQGGKWTATAVKNAMARVTA
jgi:DNA invertase Pin-like site-specific DNA recombinase